MDCLIIGRDFATDRGRRCPAAEAPARLCRTRKSTAKRAPAGVPVDADWHVKCLAIIGLSRPGKFDGDLQASFPKPSASST
jgi:hypothetical protein